MGVGMGPGGCWVRLGPERAPRAAAADRCWPSLSVKTPARENRFTHHHHADAPCGWNEVATKLNATETILKAKWRRVRTQMLVWFKSWRP